MGFGKSLLRICFGKTTKKLVPKTRINICRIASPDEGHLAMAACADAIGLVGATPSGPGLIDDETNTVQVVSHIDPAQYAQIMRDLPNIRRVQVIHLEDEGALQLMHAYAPFVHAFLDSGRPGALDPQKLADFVRAIRGASTPA